MRKIIPLLSVLFFALILSGFLFASSSAKKSEAVRNENRKSKSGFKPTTVAFKKNVLVKTVPTVLKAEPVTVRIPILLYHYVENYLEYNPDPKDTIRHGLTVVPSFFRRQMEYLVKNGYTTIFLDDLTAAVKYGKKLPSKSVILTFDDGYRDYFEDAFPVLKELGLKSINFVPVNRLNLSDNLTDSQIRILLQSGLVDIQSHTLDHLNLTQISLDSAKKQIEESKRILEQKYGIKVKFFNYPWGSFNPAITNMVKEAGYEGAVSTIKGVEHNPETLYFLRRIRIGNIDEKTFEKILNQ